MLWICIITGTEWFTISGTYLGQAGISPSDILAVSANGQFWLPEDIAVNSKSYVMLPTRLMTGSRYSTPPGTYVTKWAITSPFGVAVDASDNVYVDLNIPSPPSAPVYIYTPDGTEEGSFTTSSGDSRSSLGHSGELDRLYICL